MRARGKTGVRWRVYLTALVAAGVLLGLLLSLAWYRPWEVRAANEDELMLMMRPVWMGYSDPMPPPLPDERIIHEINRLDAVHYYSPAHDMTMLACACHTQRKEIVAWLLSAGANPNPSQGVPPIRSAVPNVEMMEQLLAHGADINAPNATVLHRLVWLRGRDKAFSYLLNWMLERGVNPLSRDQQGRTPREFAIERGMDQAARMLEAAEVAWVENDRPGSAEHK